MTTPEQPIEQHAEPTPTPARAKRGGKSRTSESPLNPAEILSQILGSSGETTVKRLQETDAEKEHRLAIEKMKAEQEIWKERWILSTYIASVVTIGFVAIIALFGSADATVRSWASGVLTSILLGLASFFAGKSIKSQ